MQVFRWKPLLPNTEELPGLLRLRLDGPSQVLLDTYYTRLDQALALWGCVTAVIFGMAQLSGLSWPVQAITDSILTLASIVLAIWLTWYWTSVKPFRWVVYFWSLLMVMGIGLTDYGIFRPLGFLLVNLCPGWLGLCALGYLLTSIGMQARALTLIGLVHLGTIPLLFIFPTWQYFLTGGVLSGSLWILASWQWDHL
jgi:hypothetical protein